MRVQYVHIFDIKMQYFAFFGTVFMSNRMTKSIYLSGAQKIVFGYYIYKNVIFCRKRRRFRASASAKQAAAQGSFVTFA